MDDHRYSISDEINDTKMNAPHVVILGAGASVAAFPNGDGNGKILPTMQNFIEIVGLGAVLDKYNIPYVIGENFEVLYGRLYNESPDSYVLKEIEEVVRKYFSEMDLPDHPTLYDHLVLSLRGKDMIATFNWDPFLYLAVIRNHKIADMPHLVFLHGAVNVGSCLKDKKMGIVGWRCPVCNIEYTRSKILYPIKQKNYNSDEFVKTEWEKLQAFLNRAHILTFFGYGAPKSDVEAIKLLKGGWGDVGKRALEQTEIIDIKPENELRETWDDFIHTHHFDVWSDFYKSWIGQHPRRTCDAMWAQNMDVKFVEGNPIPREYDFNKLWEWYGKLAKIENIKI